MRLRRLCSVQRGFSPPLVSLRRNSWIATGLDPQPAFSGEPGQGNQTSDRGELVYIRTRVVPLSLSSSRARGQRLTVALDRANGLALAASASPAPGTILAERR